jgi:hypothetical protein
MDYLDRPHLLFGKLIGPLEIVYFDFAGTPRGLEILRFHTPAVYRG